MSSNIDPSKLKVVDLRNELSARGLDSKGNKPVLVKRLQDALDEEAAKSNKVAVDASDIKDQVENKSESSGGSNVEVIEEQKPPERTRERRRSRQRSTDASKPETKPVTKSTKNDPIPEEVTETKNVEKSEPVPEQQEKIESVPPSQPQSTHKDSEQNQGNQALDMETQSLIDTNSDVSSSEKPELKDTTEQSSQQCREVDQTEVSREIDTEDQSGVQDKSKVLESETDLEIKQDATQNGDTSDQVVSTLPNEISESMDVDVVTSEADKQKYTDQTSTPKEESRKRKRSSSPSRRSPSCEDASPRKRSRSPIRENEPVIPDDKVLLSWYDSDLHLLIDKENFLMAKPISEGAFGFVWAGARSSHGVKTGKVCYEVKITEQADCEDFLKFQQMSKAKDHHPKLERRREKSRRDQRNTNTEHIKEEDAEKKPEKQDSEESDKIIEKKISDDSVKCDDKKEDTETEEKMEVVTEVQNDDKELIEAEQNDKGENNESAKDTSESSSETKPSDDLNGKVETTKDISIPAYGFRVGWSLSNCNLQLGEDQFSYGYDSTGKFIIDKQFTDYGKTYTLGDVVGSYLDIHDDQVIIRYTVNGELQPIATTLSKSNLPENFVLFPHIISRNCSFEVNFGVKDEPWFPAPSELDGYTFLSNVEDKVSGPMRPENRSDCEVLLMCGLPGVGKTQWVKQHVVDNPEKRYHVIGNASLLERMTVDAQPLKDKFPGRWSLLVDKLQKSLNKLVWMAALRRRNYIIDQTNVFPSAQRRKVRPFEGFKRRAVVLIVEDDEYTKRLSMQEEQDGKDVPDNIILEMKAAMAIPEKCDWLEEVTFVGLAEAEAKEMVKKYNAAGKEAGYGREKRFKNNRYSNRGKERGSYQRDRDYQHKRYDSSRYTQRPRGNAWGRDRYDQRSTPRRDYRSGSDYRDRARRDSYSHSQSYSGNYSRSRDQSSYRGSQGSGGSRNAWPSSNNWNQGGSRAGWNQQPYGSYGQQNWGSGSGQKWNYNQGQGYGSYGQNWNYYGQYGQGGWSQK